MKLYILLIPFIFAGVGVFAQNTFTGTNAGRNCTGDHNTFSGYASGYTTDDYYSTYMGYKSGYISPGIRNVAFGHQCNYNSSGFYSVFSGTKSGYNSDSVTLNTFIGEYSGYLNSGIYNSYLGYLSGYNIKSEYNVFIGYYSGRLNTYGERNVAIGRLSGPNSSYDNTIAIGYLTLANASNQARIGNSFTTSIGGQVSWSVLSDRRFKKNIRNNIPGLDFINELRPVSYEIDVEAFNNFQGLDTVELFTTDHKESIATTGLVAQEVEKLVKEKNYAFYGIETPKNNTDHYAIRYSEFVVPLVKALQELKTIIDDQRKEIDELSTSIINSSAGNTSQNSNGARLFQNHPDSYMSATTIEMFLPQDISRAELVIVDMNGKIHKTIPVNERDNTSIIIEGGTLKSGDYICALIIDESTAQSKRLILTE